MNYKTVECLKDRTAHAIIGIFIFIFAILLEETISQYYHCFRRITSIISSWNPMTSNDFQVMINVISPAKSCSSSRCDVEDETNFYIMPRFIFIVQLTCKSHRVKNSNPLPFEYTNIILHRSEISSSYV